MSRSRGIIQLEILSGCRISPIGLIVMAVLYVAGSDALGFDARNPFTVRDSIQWTNLLSFASSTPTTVATDIALYSPNHQYFVIHTRRGDLERNLNLESLLLYRTSEVERYVRSTAGSAPPKPVILVSVGVTRDFQSLAGIRWLDSGRLGYIAPDPEGVMQVYSADAASGAVMQMTASETNVSAYAVGTSRVVYTACDRTPRATALVKQVNSFWEALPPLADDPDCVAGGTLFAASQEIGKSYAARITLPPMRLPDYRNRLWISPSEEYAILLAPSTNAPPHWSSYQVPDYEHWGYSPKWIRSDPASPELLNRDRFLVVDLHKSIVRPLMDAPSGMVSFNFTPPEVFWRADGRSVIVTDTFLPLLGVAADERERRQRGPAIAEVNLETGSARAIVWEPVRHSLHEQAESVFLGFEWDAKRDSITILKRLNGANVTSKSKYRRVARGWKSMPGSAGPAAVVVEVRESLNARPRVFARISRYSTDANGSTEHSSGRELFDPNPQADLLDLEPTKVVHWRDAANNIDWTGGLIVPKDYEPGKRYPLIVQTHGFDPDRFLLDGPAYEGQGGTAMAAQEFASVGFAVLQIQDNPRALTSDEKEGALVAEGYRSGIDELIRLGLADPSRVGLIAFSKTGFHVLYLIDRYPSLLSAISMSDCLQTGYGSLLMVDNGLYASQIASLTGGPPTADSIGSWFANNPFYSIVRTKAPIRLEEMGSGLGFWETYFVLRAAGRSVDFVVYPEGSHVLQKPAERWASQGGTVDWFRYWLQDYEDPDPAKQQQYARWRALKNRAN